jgi:CRP/FNR family cyclic AMP-dependent transcriptional regulator
MDRVTLLRSIQLFESMDDDDAAALAARLVTRELPAGELVFEQGDEGDAMYVIESGGVDIQTGSEKQRVVLASLYNGQYFGELSLLDGAPRSARVVTTRDSVLLLLERDDFVDFVKRRPDAALAIMSELGERMRATNELMTRTVSKNAFDEVEERLTIGDRVADKVASFGGSWPFIFLFGGFMLVWMTWNSLAGGMAFDPLPFMFLNLFLSTVAALQAPFIMMSQNRQSTKDKAIALNDFHVNLKNEVSIDRLLRSHGELMQRLAMIERHLGGSASAPARPSA